MLSASDLRSGYGIGDVLQSFELAIEAGEVVSVLGRNGVGKTTGIARLARLYKDEGRSVLLGAGDTFRAAAIEQLVPMTPATFPWATMTWAPARPPSAVQVSSSPGPRSTSRPLMGP